MKNVALVFGVLALTASASIASARTIDARKFFTTHRHLTVKTYGINDNGGGGFVEVVFDDVAAGVALTIGTQDDEASLDEIKQGPLPADEASIVHHRKGHLYRPRAPKGCTVTREKPSDALTLAKIRAELNLR
jgi:hypothetical protein